MVVPLAVVVVVVVVLRVGVNVGLVVVAGAEMVDEGVKIDAVPLIGTNVYPREVAPPNEEMAPAPPTVQ